MTWSANDSTKYMPCICIKVEQSLQNMNKEIQTIVKAQPHACYNSEMQNIS